MVGRPFEKWKDDVLLLRLTATVAAAREDADPRVPYLLSEHNGLERGQQLRVLYALADAIVEECERRGLDWYRAYWGEPRPPK